VRKSVDLLQKPTLLKGNGRQGGTVGHRRHTKNGEVKYLYGLGCKAHDNCFTCPFPDCLLRSLK